MSLGSVRRRTSLSRRHGAGAILLVLLLALPLPFIPGPTFDARADSTTEFPGCSVPLRGATALVVNGYVYLFGGEGSAAIRRYDPTRPCVPGSNPETLSTTLPSAREGMAGVYTGTYVFLFGGVTPGGSYLPTIVRFDPVLETMKTVLPTCPHARAYASAGLQGRFAYFFGGHDASGPKDEILAFDTVSGELAVSSAKLPSPRSYTSAVTHDGRTYVFGGETGFSPWAATDEVLRFTGFSSVGVVAKLPVPVSRTSAVLDQGKAYVMAGRDGPLSTDTTGAITRFDTDGFVVDPMCSRIHGGAERAPASWVAPRAWVFGTRDGTRLSQFVPAHGDICPVDDAPTGVSFAEAAMAWNDTHAWFFGARVGTGPAERVLEYDARSDAFTLLSVTLPRAVMNATAVFDGTHAYVFGGRSGAGNSAVEDDILRFDPATGTVVQMGATLPLGLHYLEGVWDDRHRPADGCPDGCVYLFGGSRYHYATWPWGESIDRVYRYNPTLDVVTEMTARLPQPLSATAAAFDGTHVYLFGGRTAKLYDPPYTDKDTVLRYDPVGDTMSTMTTRLDAPIARAAAVWDGVWFYVLGGEGRVMLQRFSPGTYTGIPASGAATDRTVELLPYAVAWPRGFWDCLDKMLFHEPTAFRYDNAPANEPPQPDPVADQSVVETNTLTFTVSSAPDPEGDTRYLHMEPLPVGASFTDHGDGTGTFTWTPTHDQDGVHRVALVTHDNEEAAKHRFEIVVGDIDRPPVLDPIPDRSVVEGTTVDFMVFAHDPDNDPITLTITGLPLNATFTDNGDGTGRFVWPTREGDRGVYPMTVTATANAVSVSDPFTITVAPIVSICLHRTGPMEIDAAPDAWRTVTAVVMNMGSATDTVSFQTGALPAWTTTVPDPVTLAPGGEATVSFQVFVPEGGTGALVGLNAIPANDPRRIASLSWQVRVPVEVQIELDDPTPGVTDTLSGRLVASYVDGSPAAGFAASVVQRPYARAEAEPLGPRIDGVTDANGAFAFAFDDDLLTTLPGTHVLVGSVVRLGQVWSIERAYVVRPI